MNRFSRLGSALAAIAILSAPAVAQSDAPTAMEILDQAIAAQNGETFAAYVPDFEVRLTMTDTHPERGRINFDVDCRFKKPNRIYTAVTETALSGKSFTEGFDGQQAWYQDQDGVRLYEGRDYVEDRRKLTETASTMRQLLRFFFLGNLKKGLRSLERGEDASHEDARSGKTIHAYYLTGVGSRGGSDDGETEVQIWVEKETHYLLGVTFTPVDDPAGKVNFSFSYHRPNPQGVVVPQQGFKRDFQTGSAQG